MYAGKGILYAFLVELYNSISNVLANIGLTTILSILAVPSSWRIGRGPSITSKMFRVPSQDDDANNIHYDSLC